MAYDARARELNDQINRLTTLDDKTRQALKHFVEDYLIERNRCFDELVAMIDDEGKDHGDWRDRLSSLRSELVSRISATLSGMSNPPPEEVRTFLSITNIQEDKLLDKLQDTPIAAKRERVVEIRKNLEKMTVDLETKWKELLDRDRPMDDASKAEAEAIDKLLTEVAKEGADETATIAEKVGAMTRKANEEVGKVAEPLEAGGELAADLLARVLGALGGAISDAVAPIAAGSKYLKAAAQSYEFKVSALKGLLSTEVGVILSLYRDVRMDTKSFLEKNGLDQAKQAYAEAQGAFDSAVSSAATSPQREDVKTLAERALQKLSNFVDKVKDAVEAFLVKHNKTFVGPAGPDEREALLEFRFWEDQTRRLDEHRNDLLTRVRRWRQQTYDFWEGDIAGLPPGVRAELKKGLDGELRDIQASYDDLDHRMSESLREELGRYKSESEIP